MKDEIDGLFVGFFIGAIIVLFVIIIFVTPDVVNKNAEFLCQTHGKELIHVEGKGGSLIINSVECGPVPEGNVVFVKKDS